MTSDLRFEHRCRDSVALVPLSEELVEGLDLRLVELGFRKVVSSAAGSEWRRDRFLVWWPLRISVEIRSEDMVVSAQMYLPWFTFLVPLLALVIAAPFVPSVVLLGCTATLGGIAIVVAAVPRLRRFDLSPYACWQGLGRRIWGRRLETTLREAWSDASSVGSERS